MVDLFMSILPQTFKQNIVLWHYNSYDATKKIGIFQLHYKLIEPRYITTPS
jgi:hypothetical protein